MLEADLLVRLEAARRLLTALQVRMSDPLRPPSLEELSSALAPLLGWIEDLHHRLHAPSEGDEPVPGTRVDEVRPAAVRAEIPIAPAPLEVPPAVLVVRPRAAPFAAVPPSSRSEHARALPTEGASPAFASVPVRTEHEDEVHRDRLQALAAQLVVAEERARRELADVLHEGLGQDLVLARLKLATLRAAIGDEVRGTLDEVEGLVAQADRSVHTITFQLSPPSLHDLGLVPALEWLVEDAQSRLGLDVRITNEGGVPVCDDRMRVILFRAVRELIENVAAHSGVRAARVRVQSTPSQLRIIVEDQGRGFDASIVDLHGYGLFGMREQLLPFGGSLLVDSQPGRGTSVALTVSLPRTAGAAA